MLVTKLHSLTENYIHLLFSEKYQTFTLQSLSKCIKTNIYRNISFNATPNCTIHCICTQKVLCSGIYIMMWNIELSHTIRASWPSMQIYYQYVKVLITHAFMLTSKWPLWVFKAIVQATLIWKCWTWLLQQGLVTRTTSGEKHQNYL